MGFRKKPPVNRNRKDPSLPVFPPIAGVTASLSGGSILLTGDVPIIASKASPTGMTVDHAGTPHPVTSATQIDPFTIALLTEGYSPIVADDVLTIGSQMTGIRSNRGGMLQIGQYTF